MSIFDKIKHGAEHAFHDVEEKLKGAGHAIEKVPGHLAHDLHKEIDRLNGIIASLRHDLEKARRFGDQLGQELSSVEHVAKEIGEEIKDKAEGLFDSVESLFEKLKNLLEELAEGANLIKELQPIIDHFTKTVLSAVGHLLKEVATDLSNLINPDRIIAIWQRCKDIIADLAGMGSLVLQAAEELKELFEAAWNWVAELLQSELQQSKTDFHQLISGIHTDINSLIGKEGFPAAVPGLPYSLDAIATALEKIPESIWQHASAALHLHYLKEIAIRVKEVVTAVAENRELHIAIRLLTTTVAGFKTLIAQFKQMLAIDIDISFIDFIKGKVGGGEDSGLIAGDADADTGAGLSLGMDIYSVSGFILGILCGLLAVVTSIGTFFLDIKGA